MLCVDRIWDRGEDIMKSIKDRVVGILLADFFLSLGFLILFLVGDLVSGGYMLFISFFFFE